MSKIKKTHRNTAGKNIILIISLIIAVTALSVFVLFLNGKHTGREAYSPDKIVPSNGSAAPGAAKDKPSPQAGWKDMVEKLESEGYPKEDIDSCERYVERVNFELNEIGTFSENQGSQAQTGSPDGSGDTGKYEELRSKLDKDKAVYLMVKLKKDFKSIENVFDEYLTALQLDIDLNEYITDINSYNKIKAEKAAEKEVAEFINAERIEAKMLDNLQKQNERNRMDNLNPNVDINNPGGSNSLPGLPQPDVNTPKADIPLPADPADELRKKIVP